MGSFYDEMQQSFVMEDFARQRPFASFLPGIAGPYGLPMWVFYTNRGQAIASFGIANRENPIVEFEPANKAYQITPYTGFRTFVKLVTSGELYQPFAPWEADRTRMVIRMNELELQAIHPSHGLQTSIAYFTLSDEPFAGLARRVTLTNLNATSLELEVLDGLPWVQPYGVDERGLQLMGRTLEAWKSVQHLTVTPEGLRGVPFYRFQSSAGDTAEVTAIRAGHFYLAFCATDEGTCLLPPLVDPDVIFAEDTSLHTPQGFLRQPLSALQASRQITTGKTPCGFFGRALTLEPGASFTLYALIGHLGNEAQLDGLIPRLSSPAYFQSQQARARSLAQELTDVVATQTADPRFDAYCRQTFLDNVLRGGWPLLLGAPEKPHVYHIYSRKHGDMERDYNAFYLAPEMLSQGNGNFRDVAQNRRNDVFFEPRVADFNVLSFLNLIQTDGYNPLVIQGQQFTLAPEYHAEMLNLVRHPQPLAAALSKPFTPGGLLRLILEQELGLLVAPEELINRVLAKAEARFQATFGEGYWIDHWFYLLDLIDTYLSLYPEREQELFFQQEVGYFYSPKAVLPRDKQFVLTPQGVRRYHALYDKPAAPLEAGANLKVKVFVKLLGLALLKFTTLDPLGMGIEMEAGRPGWYDALNGLPGLMGSSVNESYELLRLLTLLSSKLELAPARLSLPVELANLLTEVYTLLQSPRAGNAFAYWDAVNSAREAYRARTLYGFSGELRTLATRDLVSILRDFRIRVQNGLERATALNSGIPPTYIAYTITDYTLLEGSDAQGRPYVRPLGFTPHLLPLFLEGPVHALKLAESPDKARAIHERVRASALYDQKLGMYKVNAPLDAESHELGRCRAFTPGWLENESIWLHMEYKYLLELLRAGLYDAFYADLPRTMVCFFDPAIYGRSPLENSSFIVSSAHPDERLHGNGFVARLSGATAEFLSMWTLMFIGPRPFFLRDGQLCLALKPALPGSLFRPDGTVRFKFLGTCEVTYHNPQRQDTFAPEMTIRRYVLSMNGKRVEIEGTVIPAPYAEQVRAGKVTRLEVFF